MHVHSCRRTKRVACFPDCCTFLSKITIPGQLVQVTVELYFNKSIVLLPNLPDAGTSTVYIAGGEKERLRLKNFHGDTCNIGDDTLGAGIGLGHRLREEKQKEETVPV
jgi:hypothetical protein